MARSALRFLFLLLSLVLAFGGLFLWGYAQYVGPGPSQSAVTVIIPQGTGVLAIGQLLADRGVVANPAVFHLGARLSGADSGLKAGEYEFPAKIGPREAVAIIRSGKTVVRRFTVAEGLTAAQIVEQLKNSDGFAGDVGRLPAEGRLLPETYHFSYGDSRSGMVARMQEAMDHLLAKLWAERAEGLPFKSPSEALILASIVERETGLVQERPLIARVFINRLQNRMRLQSDPTVVYGLTQGQGSLDRPLSTADLRNPTPFNTYVIEGLPPAPICNPGLAALLATLHPAESDVLYFVADGTGGHAFSRTLAEHNRNVARWRALANGRAPAPGRAVPVPTP